MRRRLVSGQPDKLKVTRIRVSAPASLVTLESPEDGLERAHGAFVRLRPEEGLTPLEIDSWRDKVIKVARAVKVLPLLQAADVPDAAQRMETGQLIGSIREEALALAEETKNDMVIKSVTEILDQVGAA